MMVQYPKKAIELANKEIPQELIKQRSGGGSKTLNYISGRTVIDMLNQAYGYLWSWEVKKEWIEECIDKPIKDWNTKKITGMEKQSPVAHVSGVLRVPIFDDNNNVVYTIEKHAHGSKGLNGGQSDQEHVFKAAATDALKKAAQMLNFGAELARDEEEQSYFEEVQTEQVEQKPDIDYLKDVLINTNNWTEEDIEENEEHFDFIEREFAKLGEDIVSGLNICAKKALNDKKKSVMAITPDDFERFMKIVGVYIDKKSEAK